MVDATEADAAIVKAGIWTCPNDNTICTARANSAKRQPKRIFERIQCIPTGSRPLLEGLPAGSFSV
jgi:hypothetical protein